jgi:hypothetical protein
LKILGLDPGIKNFGFGVINIPDITYSYLKDTYIEIPEILESGLLQNIPLYFNKVELDPHLLRLSIQELQGICLRHSVDKIGIERWMGRGTFMPGWVERLNHIIGVMLYSSPIPIKALTAASWKTKILKHYNIKSTKTLLGNQVKTEHAGDAIMQATYIHELDLIDYLKEEKKKTKKEKKCPN